MKPCALVVLAVFLSGCAVLTRDTIVFQGNSMLPGIRDGDRLEVEKFGPDDKVEVKRGDVIVFWYPADPSKSYLKRLVGMPGETVEIREGAVFINGSRFDEPYVDPKFNTSRSSHQPLDVKEHYYYVLGDNRDASSDSRIWGLVPEKYIYAKVIPDTNPTRKSR